MKSLGYKPNAMVDCSKDEMSYPSIYLSDGPLFSEIKNKDVGDKVYVRFKARVVSKSEYRNDDKNLSLELLEGETYSE